MISGQSGAPLVEFPLSTLRLGGTNFPIAGGGYLRLFPYAYTHWGIRYLNSERGSQPSSICIRGSWTQRNHASPQGNCLGFGTIRTCIRWKSASCGCSRTSPLVQWQKSCNLADCSGPDNRLRGGTRASPCDLLA